MSMLTQSLVLGRLALSDMRQRPGSALVVVMGFTCVTAVLVAMFSIATGILRVLESSVDPLRAIVLPVNAIGEYGTDLAPSQVDIILSAPGIARDAAGRAVADAETVANVPPVDGFAQGSLAIRGIGHQGEALRPELRIIAGRRFSAGHQELIAGAASTRAFHFKLGDKIIMPDGEWPIVGIFTGGGQIESALMADAQTLMASTRRTGYGSVIVRLTDAGQFPIFKAWLLSNPALQVSAETQAQYYQRMGSQRRFYEAMAYLVGSVMSFGAVCGAINILYSTVRTRTREIATLRAIGYEPWPVALSVVLQSLVLAVTGAALGCLLAWAAVDGHESGSGLVFRWSVSAGLVGAGLAWAAALALASSIPPALRAARVSVIVALRVG